MSGRVMLLLVVAASLFAVGSAQAAPSPLLAWSPTTSGPPFTYNFGAVSAVAGKTASQIFKLTNSGASATSALKVSLTASSVFSKTADTCTGTSLGPKKSCSVTIVYAPVTSGQLDLATLTASALKSSAAALALEGNGAASVSCPGQRFVGPSDVSVPALTAGKPDCRVTFAGGELSTAGLSVGVPWAADGTGATGTFNQSGQVVRFTDAAGNATSLNRGPSRVLTATDPLGNPTHPSYDASGHLLALGQTTLTYDSAGQVIKVIDRLGDATDFAYDASGDLVSVTDSSGTTSLTYDAAGEPTSITDPFGHTSSLVYDSSGDLVSTTDQSGTTTFTYDSFGDLLTVTDPLGHTSSFVYDSSGDLVRKTDQSGTTTFTYDSSGDLLTVTDPLGHISAFSY